MTSSQDPLAFLTFDRLVVKPPVTQNSVKNFDPTVVAQDANSTQIVVHPRFPDLVGRFLAHKREHGSTFEKELYATADSFTWQHEVSRLIEKRPLVFMGSEDFTILRDGTQLRSPREEWDRNGKEEQSRNKTLTLANYLSYDEIMLGSLLGVSGPSYFINDGNRFNGGRTGRDGTFEPRGIIIGLVGARFERRDRMDSMFMRPPVERRHQDGRVTKIFENFFGATRNLTAPFDKAMYQARMRVTVDILLLEADARAKEAGKKAYTYVVGLGLGVWQYVHEQGKFFVDVFVAALRDLSVSNISTLEFAWIDVEAECQERVTKVAADKGIKTIFSKRNPAAKLDTDELLVLSYAWDGNAFPGNEYWMKSLSASGDPAAACMSTIGELHNPLVNPFTQRIRIL